MGRQRTMERRRREKKGGTLSEKGDEEKKGAGEKRVVRGQCEDTWR